MSGLMAKPLLLIRVERLYERERPSDQVVVVLAIALPPSSQGAVLLLARIFDDEHCAQTMTIKRVKNAG